MGDVLDTPRLHVPQLQLIDEGQIDEGQRTFRSQAAYVSLVAVLIVSALIIVIWNSPSVAAMVGALGLVWVALTLRSAIRVTDDGFEVRGLLRTRHLTWADTDAFIVVGFSGPTRSLLSRGIEYDPSTPDGPRLDGVSMDMMTNAALAARVNIFSVVAAVTSHGERLRVHGTTSTPLDPTFPAYAAAELNNVLKQHNPSATAS